jgi:uncharacterized membrane protein
MAKFFSPKMKRLLAHSLVQFISVLVFSAFAIALTFVGDFCRTSHRPAWLIDGFEWLSICVFIVDGISLISITAIVPWRLIRNFLKEARES